MPRGDGTGPLGQGPMTGRAVGYCAGYNTPGYANLFPRRKFVGRAGMGRGFGGRFRGPPTPGFGLGRGGLPRSLEGYVPEAPILYTQPTKEQELNSLNKQKEILKQDLDSLEKRIEELKGKKE